MKAMSDRASRAPWSKIRRMFAMAQQMEDVVNFGIGEPDFATPEVVCQAANKAIADGYTHYTANAGLPELRKAVASKLARDNGVDADGTDGVIVTAGGMGALYLSVLSLVNEGDEVIVPDPVWTNYEGQVILSGGSMCRVPAGRDVDFALDAERLRNHITPKSKLLILNSPANPTGSVISSNDLAEIAQLAADHDLYVVSDEVYEHFVWEGAQHTSIASFPAARDRTITIGSFSKSYAMTGWRVGYAAGPPEIISTMVKTQESIFACASSVSQMAALAALEHGGDSLAQMMSAYKTRRKVALELLSNIPGVTAVRPKGTFYIFVDISELSESSERFAIDLLQQERVVVVPGTAFGPGGEGYVRISYATDESQIRDGMGRLARYVSSKRSDPST